MHQYYSLQKKVAQNSSEWVYTKKRLGFVLEEWQISVYWCIFKLNRMFKMVRVIF